MHIKVFDDGQIVIPREIRRAGGIHSGNEIEVKLDTQNESTEIHKTGEARSEQLAGVFAAYGGKRSFPDREDMKQALGEGMDNE